jgi:hypothetical protein
VGGFKINVNLKGSLDNAKLDEILRRLKDMAVDQATFDAALTDFSADLETGLQAIADKIAGLDVPVDLTNELAALSDARSKFDAAVAADTNPPPAGG